MPPTVPCVAMCGWKCLNPPRYGRSSPPCVCSGLSYGLATQVAAMQSACTVKNALVLQPPMCSDDCSFAYFNMRSYVAVRRFLGAGLVLTTLLAGCRHACFPRYYTTLDTLASQLVRRGPKQRMARLSRVVAMQSSTTTASHPPTHPTTVASDKRAARTRDAIRNGAWPGDSHWQCLLLTRCVLSNSCPGVLSARQGDILEYL